MIFRDTCRFFRDKLPLHAGRDLEPKLERRVDAHLSNCLSCFREFRSLTESRAVLGVVAEERLPAGLLDGFTEEVMARIEVGDPGPAAPLPRVRGPRPMVPLLAAAAALLIVATAAWRLFDEGETTLRPEAGTVAQPSFQVDSQGARQGGGSRPLISDPMVAPLVWPKATNPALGQLDPDTRARELLRRRMTEVQVFMLKQGWADAVPEVPGADEPQDR